MVNKKKKVKEKPLQHLEKAIEKVKDSRLKDDVKTLIKTDNEASSRWVVSFPFQVREVAGPSFPEVEEEKPVKKPVVLERVVSLERQTGKEERREVKYENQATNYNGAQNDDRVKSSENLGYDSSTKFHMDYNDQSVRLDTRSQAHKEASISPSREERLGDITLLSDLELRQAKKDASGRDLIGENITRDTGKDYKLGRRSSINKGDYARKYE